MGDPTEGALVVLASKGGVDPVTVREEYPRLAVLPFDSAYKLMATFHRMKGEDGREVVRCLVEGRPRLATGRSSYGLDANQQQVDIASLRLELEGCERATRHAGIAGHGRRAQGLLSA